MPRRLSTPQIIAVLAVGIAFGLGVTFHWGHLNGFPQITHREWAWRNLGNLRPAELLLPPGLLIGFVLWRAQKGAIKRYWPLLGWLAFANFLLQILGMIASPGGLQFVERIVTSGLATSYFDDALGIQSLILWMSRFHEADLNLHSSTHPPGPILFFYLFIKIFGAAKAPLLAGCAVGLVGSMGVFVIYKFAELWSPERFVRLHAAALYALLPTLTVFFPEFDQAYPILSMLLMLCWVKALSLDRASTKEACCAGIVLFVATFFAYNLLATGVFLAYYALYWLWREAWSRTAWSILLRTSAVVLGGCASLYMALWATTGYNPLASFLHAAHNQTLLAQTVDRPYATFIVFDLYDFALGAGIMALPVLLFRLSNLPSDSTLTWIGVASILTVDVSGLLRGETARVWLFLQPLIVVPVSVELSRLPWPWRLSVFAVQWWIVVCLKAKMWFVAP
jgi:hypothetical protein